MKKIYVRQHFTLSVAFYNGTYIPLRLTNVLTVEKILFSVR